MQERTDMFCLQEITSRAQGEALLLLLLLKSSLLLMTEYQSPPAADTVALLRSHGNCLITIKSKELKFFTIADFLQIFIHRFNMF